MIEFEQLEAGIYVYYWRGTVKMTDAQAAFEAFSEVHDGGPYAAIIDMRELKNLPRDFNALRSTIKREVRAGLQGYVLVGAPRTARLIIKSVSVLAPTTYQFADDRDTALQMARALLPEVETEATA